MKYKIFLAFSLFFFHAFVWDKGSGCCHWRPIQYNSGNSLLQNLIELLDCYLFNIAKTTISVANLILWEEFLSWRCYSQIKSNQIKLFISRKKNDCHFKTNWPRDLRLVSNLNWQDTVCMSVESRSTQLKMQSNFKTMYFARKKKNYIDSK